MGVYRVQGSGLRQIFEVSKLGSYRFQGLGLGGRVQGLSARRLQPKLSLMLLLLAVQQLNSY